jgi:hypothetical protein
LPPAHAKLASVRLRNSISKPTLRSVERGDANGVKNTQTKPEPKLRSGEIKTPNMEPR